MTEQYDNSEDNSNPETKKDQIEGFLEKINPKIFKGLKQEKKDEILEGIREITITQSQSLEVSHSGPLPPPQDLKKYNDIINNGAERIMAMAEKQQDHRIGIEKKVIHSQISQSKAGQIFGFILGLVGLICGSYLIYKGHDLAGASLAGGTLVGLVSVFVIGKKSQSKDLKEKREGR